MMLMSSHFCRHDDSAWFRVLVGVLVGVLAGVLVGVSLGVPPGLVSRDAMP
jgi:hypothetical protein